ncbi:MAG: O-antigen ligase family protein [Clostridia bacterium]|nr:O-antigen ligase family protein [Clostridia bacterium]
MNATRTRLTITSFKSKELWMIAAIWLSVVAGTFNNLFSVAAFLLSAAAIVFWSEEKTICMLMFIMPLTNIFKMSPSSQSFFTYLILIYVIAYALKRQNIKMAFFVSIVCFCLFLLFQVVLSMHILRLIKLVTNLCFIYLVLDSRSGDNKNVFLFYIAGIIVSSSMAYLDIVPNLVNYIGEQDLGYHFDHLARFSGTYPDPNYYAINVIISLCLVVLLNHNGQLSNLASTALSGILVVFALLTYSKSAFLMLVLPLLFLLYSKIKQRKYFIFLVLIAVGAVFAVNMFAGKIEILNTVLARFSDADDASSLTTGRTDLWMDYFNYLLANPLTLLFGKGLGADILNSHAAHNTYLDLLYYLGIVGSLILLYVFHVIGKLKKRESKSNLLNKSVWICIIVMYFFLSELFYFDWRFHIIIAFLVNNTEIKQVGGGEL